MISVVSRCLSAALLTALLTVGAAAGTTRAILVGVSDYTYLDADLNGPRNDVALMMSTLLQRGLEADNILALTDQDSPLPPGATRADPTRAAILSALASVTGDSVAGDTVLFYFSGHGSQAPDLDGDEAGGYDEIFLPADAKAWNGTIGAVENAIVDDELRLAFAGLLDKGVTVVAIVDACHSGTGFRALGGAGVARQVAPEDLGVPDVPGTEALPVGLGALSGDYVFLYSSQSDQRSFEHPHGDAEDPANWYGDFTVALTQSLAAAGDASYAQLLEAARDRMKGGAATAAQTPDGEGPMLEAAVFGEGAGLPARIAVHKGYLLEGALSDVRIGARYALYAGAQGGTPIGTAEVAKVEARLSRLSPLGDTDLPGEGFAELTAPGLPEPVVIAPPVAVDTFDGYEYRPLVAAVKAIGDAGVIDGLSLSEEAPDAVLVLTDGRLALADRDGVLDGLGAGSSPRLALKGDDVEAQIASWLDRITHAIRLRKALDLVKPAGGFTLPGSGLKVALERRAGTPGGAGCAKIAPGALESVGDGGTLGHCDQLWVNLANLTSKPQDVTILYVDRDFAVSALWPRDNQSNRLTPGEEKSLGFLILAPQSETGTASPAHEELIVLAAPGDADGPRTVLTGLADDGGTMRGADGGTAAFLAAALDPDASSRAFGETGAVTPVKVFRYWFEVLPPGR
jgi:hypothetical protein